MILVLVLFFLKLLMFTLHFVYIQDETVNMNTKKNKTTTK